MSEQQVQKLYATIVPKLSKNFEQDLSRQLQRVQQRIKPTVNFALKVNQRSVQAISTQLNHIARDRQSAIKVGVQGDKLAASKLAFLSKQRNSDVKVNLISAIAQAKVAELARDRTIKLKVDVDKNNLAQIRSGIGGAGGGLSTAAKGVGAVGKTGMSGVAAGIESLGFAFGRMSDVAGVAGVVLQGTARVLKGFGSVASSAAEGGAAFGTAMAEAAATAGLTVVVAVITAVVLAFVGAIAAGTLAVVGFTIAAVVAGAVVTALSVAIGGIAVAITAVMGALGAFAGALLVVGLALAPVIEAFSHFMAVEDEAAKESTGAAAGMKKQAAAIASSAAAIRAADTAVRGAQQGVIDAQRNIVLSQRGVANAQRGVQEANERLTDSLREQQRAREGLTAAEETARRNLESLRRAARDAAGENEDAELRLIRAREELAAMDPIDNDLTDYREKLREVEQAERDVADTRTDGANSVKDYETERKKGIRNSDAVIAAQEQLANANRNVRDSTIAIKDAQLQLSDAEYAVGVAVREHHDAELRLQEAIISRTEAGKKQNDIMVNGAAAADTSTAAQRKLSKSFGELTAAGQAFFETLKETWSWIKRLSKIAQTAFLPGLTSAFESMKTLAPVAERGVERLGKTLGKIASDFGKWFGSNEGVKVFEMLFDSADTALKIMGETALEMTKILLPAMAQLMRDGAPVMKSLGGALVLISGAFAELFKTMGTKQNIASMSIIVEGLGIIISDLINIFGQFMTVAMSSLARDMPVLIDGLSKLAQGFFDVLGVLMVSGLIEGFSKFMGLIGETLTEMANNGSITAIGDAMGDILVVLGQGMKDLAQNEEATAALVEFVGMLPRLLQEFLKYLPSMMTALLTFGKVATMLTQVLTPEIVGSITAMTYLVTGPLYALVGILSFLKQKWDETWALMGYIFEAFVNFVRGHTGGLLDMFGGVVKVMGKFSSVLSPITALGGMFEENTENANGLSDATQGLTGVFSGTTGALATMSGGMDNLNGKFSTGVERALTLSDAVDGLRAKTAAAAQAARDSATVNTTWKTSQEALTTAVKTNGTAITGQSTAAKANREAFKLATQASYDLMLQDIKSGKPLDESIKRHKDRATSLQNEFGKSKEAKNATADLIKKYGEVPKDVSTLLKTLGFKATTKEMESLLIKQMAGRKGVELGDATTQFYRQKKNTQMLAAGGPVRGPGTKTSDSISAMLSAGEYVQPAHVVDHYGQDFMENLRKKRIPRDGIRQYAKGGMVWPYPIDVTKTKIPPVGDLTSSGALVGSGGSGSAGGGYQNMFKWIDSRVKSSVLTSGLRQGDPGYHGKGRAVDLTFTDGSERKGGGEAAKAFNLIKSSFMKDIKELIWDFAGNKAVWNGQNHMFRGAGAGPGTHNDHIHWAMKSGGLVSGAGTGQSDSVLRRLSNGEFVMSAPAVKAIGARHLAAANQAPSRLTRNTPRGTLGVGNHFDQGGSPNFVDQSRNIQMDVHVTEAAHADLVVHRINALL